MFTMTTPFVQIGSRHENMVIECITRIYYQCVAWLLLPLLYCYCYCYTLLFMGSGWAMNCHSKHFKMYKRIYVCMHIYVTFALIRLTAYVSSYVLQMFWIYMLLCCCVVVVCCLQLAIYCLTFALLPISLSFTLLAVDLYILVCMWYVWESRQTEARLFFVLIFVNSGNKQVSMNHLLSTVILRCDCKRI